MQTWAAYHRQAHDLGQVSAVYPRRSLRLRPRAAQSMEGGVRRASGCLRQDAQLRRQRSQILFRRCQFHR